MLSIDSNMATTIFYLVTTPVEESPWEDRRGEEGEGGKGDQEAELGQGCQPSHL